jgi:hypothetical protein
VAVVPCLLLAATQGREPQPSEERTNKHQTKFCVVAAGKAFQSREVGMGYAKPTSRQVVYFLILKLTFYSEAVLRWLSLLGGLQPLPLLGGLEPLPLLAPIRMVLLPGSAPAKA